MRMVDIAGQRFGRLTVVSVSHTNTDNKVCWNCVCDCGVNKVINGRSLRSGNTHSCGCIARAQLGDRARTHGGCSGGKKTPEYHIWRAIISRCCYPNNKNYHQYGGRGIKICDEWHTDFLSFIESVGKRPDKSFWLDRLKNDKGYEPGNCKWVTIEDQQNNKRTNRILTHNNESHTVAEWAKKLSIPSQRIYQRLHRGVSISKALKEAI
jgi:hypothetical protein